MNQTAGTIYLHSSPRVSCHMQMSWPLLRRSLGMGCAAALLFIHSSYGVGLSLPIFFGISWLLSPHRRPTPLHLLVGTLSWLPCLYHSLWTQHFIVPVVLYFCFHLCCQGALRNLGAQWAAIPRRIWEAISALAGILVIPSVFTSWAPGEGSERLKLQGLPILKGLVCSIPACLIFGALLSSADPRYETWFLSLLGFDSMSLWRLGVFILVSLFVISFEGITQRSSYDDSVVGSFSTRNIRSSSLVSFLAPINVLFLAYILLQISYLFGGEDVYATIASGAPQRTYMREGFVQINITAFLVALVIWVGRGKADSSRNAWVMGSLSLLVVQTLAILASSAWRLLDFIANTGPTLMRYQVALFMVWLLGALLIALAFIWGFVGITRAVKVIAGMGFFLLATFSALPYETFLVRHTYTHFMKTGYLFDGVHLLNSVSGDGLLEIRDLIQVSHPRSAWKGEQAKENHWNAFVEGARPHFYELRRKSADAGGQDWRALNFPEYLLNRR